MLRVFASPRRRRRLGLAAALVTLGVIIYLGVHFSSPGSSENATGPELPDYKTPKTVPFTRQDRRAVRKVLAKFIATAVSRRHVERSWDLASATMREGVTRKEWERGSIHPSGECWTFDDWTAGMARHDEAHLGQLRDALTG